MKHKGFTLIELLVVVAIIGILATVVLASLNSARDKATLAKYQAEARSRVTAIAACDYVGDTGNCQFSGSTCGTLGWSAGSSNQNGPDVYADCGESDASGLTCTEGVTWKEAYDACESVGARLCTLTELEAEIPSNTGCGYDNYDVWTMTPCDDGFYTTRGEYGANNPSYLHCHDIDATISEGGYASGTNIGVRCCADNAPL